MLPVDPDPASLSSGRPATAGGFRLVSTEIVAPGHAPWPTLAALTAYWFLLAEDEGLPSLADADPDRLQVIPGRVHLVRVEGPRRFRFLHYGAAVTNPDARDMRGMTTDDYADRGFGALVTDHYAEGAALRRPVCRTIRAEVSGEHYDYARVVAPFGLDGEAVEFLVIATQRFAVPSAFERGGETCDPAALRDVAERMRRLALQVAGTESGISLTGLATAAALHFSEATRLASRRGAAG